MSKLQDFHDTAYLSSLDLLQKFLAEPKRDVNAVDEVWFYLQFCQVLAVVFFLVSLY